MRMLFDQDYSVSQIVQQHSEASPHEDHGFTFEVQAVGSANAAQHDEKEKENL